MRLRARIQCCSLRQLTCVKRSRRRAEQSHQRGNRDGKDSWKAAALIVMPETGPYNAIYKGLRCRDHLGEKRRVVQITSQRTRVAATAKLGRVERLATRKASNTCDIQCLLTGTKYDRGTRRDRSSEIMRLLVLTKQSGRCSLHFMYWHAHQMPSVIQSANKLVRWHSRVRHGAIRHSAIPLSMEVA